MIACPNCRSGEVLEERHIPLPTGKLSARARVLMLSIKGLFTGIQVGCVLAILAGMLTTIVFNDPESPYGPTIREWLTQNLGFVPPAILLNPCSFIVMAAVGLVVFQLLTTTIVGWLSKTSSSLRLKRRPLKDWPRIYLRTCISCGLHWTWTPGQKTIHKAAETLPNFACPQCGTEIDQAFEKISRSCPRCGFTLPTPKALRKEQKIQRFRAYQPYLQILASHWEGTYEPTRTIKPSSEGDLIALFDTYRRTLGEDPYVEPGYEPTGYIRNHQPERSEILAFLQVYLQFLDGERDLAIIGFQRLTQSHPHFVEPWIWLSALEGDPEIRRAHLEQAIAFEPAHPLALDALAMVRGEASPHFSGIRIEDERAITLVRCSQCGGGLINEPDGENVVCAYCGHVADFHAAVIEEAPRVSTLRLKRFTSSSRWVEVEVAWRCQGCGAELAMNQRIAEICVYCGSLNTRIDEHEPWYEQPGGLLPFAITQAQAIERIQHELKPILRAKSSIIKSFRGDDKEPYGIYVPYWRFDGVIEIRWLYREGDQITSSRRGKKILFEGVHLPAVTVPPLSCLDLLQPYPLRQVVPYEPARLADRPAQRYDLDVEMVVEDAYDIMLWMAQWKEGLPITTTSDGQHKAYRSLQVNNMTYRLLLLPIWVTRLNVDETQLLALVNGSTGRVALSSPLIRSV